MTTRVAHVLPVSDDGGSTAEIVRVLGMQRVSDIAFYKLFGCGCILHMMLFRSIIGGPAVGDIRSRCLRLSDESTFEALAVRRLLGHRLPLDPSAAKSEWYALSSLEKNLFLGLYLAVFASAISGFICYLVS